MGVDYSRVMNGIDLSSMSNNSRGSGDHRCSQWCGQEMSSEMMSRRSCDCSSDQKGKDDLKNVKVFSIQAKLWITDNNKLTNFMFARSLQKFCWKRRLCCVVVFVILGRQSSQIELVNQVSDFYTLVNLKKDMLNWWLSNKPTFFFQKVYARRERLDDVGLQMWFLHKRSPWKVRVSWEENIERRKGCLPRSPSTFEYIRRVYIRRKQLIVSHPSRLLEPQDKD